MRELKFRAWDTKDKTMVMNPLGFPEIYPLKSLMQFTGMKDREGQDIYESDVLKISFGIPPTTNTLIVTWNTECCCWWFENINPNYCSAQAIKKYSDNIEVIGNIYENIELLEKDKPNENVI